MNSGIILLAEDDPLDANLTVRALAGIMPPHQVAVVTDGARALDYLYRRGEFKDRPSRQPAVVLLDLKMPKADGLEVLRQIKGDKDLRRIPVVILTSSSRATDVNDCYQSGANGYMVKRMDFDGYQEALQSFARYWLLVNHPPEPPERERPTQRGAWGKPEPVNRAP